MKQTIAVIKNELDKFNGFWKKLLRRFQNKIFDEQSENTTEDKKKFSIVADDLDIIHDFEIKKITL